MKEFFLQHFDAIVYAVLAVLGAFATLFGVSIGQLNKLRKILTRDKSKSSGYRVLCPHCKKESALEDVHFLLPSGAVDDNLNGVPDHEEN